MQKQLSLAFALLLLAAACSPSSETFSGNFQGVLPCADCTGIDTTLVINDDHTYKLSRVYQGKDPQAFIEEGLWTLDQKVLELKPNVVAANGERYCFALTDDKTLTPYDILCQPMSSKETLKKQ